MGRMSSNGGVGVAGILGVVFVTLKLTGVVDWSWWIVTLPFWGGFAVVVLVVVSGVTALYIADEYKRKKGIR